MNIEALKLAVQQEQTIEALWDRIERALETAWSSGQVDGSHHKMWVIDQMVRELTKDGYEAFKTDYEEDGEYEWDEGVPP